MKAANLFKKFGAEFNILTVVTKDVASNPEKLYHFYKDHDFRYTQLTLCLDSFLQKHESNPFSLSGKLFGNFLSKIFDLWYDDFIKGDYYSIRTFDNYVRILMGETPENCGMKGYCESYPVIEANGSVYPCDFYVLDQYKIEDIHNDSFKEMLNGKISKNFMNPSHHFNELCKKFEYVNICRGGCRRDCEHVKENTLQLNYYCEGYKIFFNNSLPRLMNIAQKMPRRS